MLTKQLHEAACMFAVGPEELQLLSDAADGPAAAAKDHYTTVQSGRADMAPPRLPHGQHQGGEWQRLWWSIGPRPAQEVLVSSGAYVESSNAPNIVVRLQGTLAVFIAPDPVPEEGACVLMEEDRFKGWCRNTDVAFTVINHLDPALSVVKRAPSRAGGTSSLRVPIFTLRSQGCCCHHAGLSRK